MDDSAERGGDSACWMHRVCPECGALPTDDEPDRCWRCGTRQPVDADES